MRHRIRRISVLQTASTFAVLYAILALIFFVPFVYLMTHFAPTPSDLPSVFTGGFVLIFPVLYGIMGFVFTAIAASVYNLVAGWMGGGIEIELIEADGAPSSANS